MSGRTLLQSWAAGADAGVGLHWGALLPAARWRPVVPSPLLLEVEAAGPVSVMGRSFGRTACVAALPGTGRVGIGLDEDWLWIESDAEVASVRWSIEGEIEAPRILAIVPTIGRVAETRAQIANFLASDLVDLVLVVDQRGGVAGDPGIAELAASAPGRVRTVEQGNFGGSGGYARGMLEALATPDRAVLLSDDDAYLPPESLRRMALHQELARRAGVAEIVGAPVLDAEDPKSLQICAEYVRDSDFFWTKADSLYAPMRTDEDPDALADALDRHHAPNYAGWWGCLLPPGALERLGGPLPLFLKWDDAEYGLRAVDAGYAIEVLPGTGVQHPRWDTTSTLWSWSGPLAQRNRLAVAASRGASRGVLASSLAHQFKHVLSLQYDVAESWNAAGCAAGDPAWFGADLLSARDWATRTWRRAHEETERTAASASTDGPAKAVRDWRAARNSSALRALGVLLAPRRLAREVREVPARAYAWWDSLGADVVRLDEYTGPALVADPARARRLVAESIATHARLALSWRRLRAEYASRAEAGARFDSWSAVLSVPIPEGDRENRAGGASRHGKAHS